MSQPTKVASVNSDWDFLADAIGSWSKRHPQEWIDFLGYMKSRRTELRDQKYGLGKESNLRETAAFPAPVTAITRTGKKRVDDVMKIIEKFLPNIWEQGEVGRQLRAKFLQKFPQFRVPERV